MNITPYKIGETVLILEGIFKGKRSIIEGYLEQYQEVDIHGNFIPKGEKITNDILPYLEWNNEFKIEEENDTLLINKKGIKKDSLVIEDVCKRFRFKQYLYKLKIINMDINIYTPHRIIYTTISK